MNTYNVIGASTEQAVYRRKGKDGGNYDTLDLLRKNNLCSCVVHDGSGSCALLASLLQKLLLWWFRKQSLSRKPVLPPKRLAVSTDTVSTPAKIF